MAGEAQLGDDLKRPLAQAHPVLRARAHVFPVNPLYVGGAARARVHWDAACAADREEEEKRASVHVRFIHWHPQLAALVDALERADALQPASSRANRKRGHRVFLHATLSAEHRQAIQVIFT